MTKKSIIDLYAQKGNCCGCEMCSQQCPKNVISMERDAEGFLYPIIRDNSGCIGCNLCQKVCPIKNVGKIHSEFKSAYAGWLKNRQMVVNSASGGAATAISERFIENGGIVYGVAYSNDYKEIEYIRATEIPELSKLKTSKYAQASKKGVLSLMAADLRAGKNVLFIGVPCDCAAIKNSLCQYENLVIVSLVCHGPTSPSVHEQYCTSLEKQRNSSIINFSVRYKKNGKWKPYYVHADFEDGSEYLEKFEDSVYNKAFLFFKRPSCNECLFKVDKFVADILVGDFHAAKPGTDTYNENGVSSLLVLTARGEKLLHEIEDIFFIKEIGIQESTHQAAINHPLKKRANRNQFSSTFVSKGLKVAGRLASVKIIECYDRFVKDIKVTGVRIKKMIR